VNAVVAARSETDHVFYEEDSVRAPIAPKRDILVGPGSGIIPSKPLPSIVINCSYVFVISLSGHVSADPRLHFTAVVLCATGRSRRSRADAYGQVRAADPFRNLQQESKRRKRASHEEEGNDRELFGFITISVPLHYPHAVSHASRSWP